MKTLALIAGVFFLMVPIAGVELPIGVTTDSS